MRRFLLAVPLALAMLATAQAADYPTKPVRILVPYGPGGATDIVARILGEHLKEKFRQPIVVENKPGGSGIVALQELVRSRPDGHTMLIGNITTNLLVPLIGDPPTPFDTFKDLVPVARLVDVPAVFLATKVNFPPNKVQEVVDLRARGRARSTTTPPASWPIRTSISSCCRNAPASSWSPCRCAPAPAAGRSI
jgi:tripartite-type tricarboxylate transporter receptor subunit TctC